MKLSFLILLCLISKPVFAETTSDSLSHYESFYNAMEPAIENGPEAFVCYMDVPHPLFNVVMHLCCENVREKVEAILERVPNEKPISFWIHPQNRAPGLVEILQEKGWGSLITCPLFSWQVEPRADVNADIRRADMDIFHEILANVYGLDDSVKRAYEKIMEKLDLENYLIYENGVPIGTATLFVKGSIGGIFNDATIPGRREATSAMTEFLMRRSAELQLKELVLLSSPEGEELYGDLGFTKVFDIEIYSQL